MSEPKDLTKYFDQLLNNSIDENDSELDLLKVFTSRRVLITGAAGSIGSEISKKIILHKPASVGLLDINESELNNLMLDLTEQTNIPVHLFLCDVSRRNSLQSIFNSFKPELVFHVAAYKHIHILEDFPDEALRVNILGTYNVASLSGEFNVDKFVFISTDKAVNPISKMGQSKKAAEAILLKLGKFYKTDFIVIRLCNVLGSRGSVSEIFIRQILKGGPVTLTHPDMKRYFITLPQAAIFTLKAAEFGRNGCLFIPRLNKPIKITELLNALIKKFNPSIESQIEVITTGFRKGEKLIEEILTLDEIDIMTSVDGLLKIEPYKMNQDYFEFLSDFLNIEDDEYLSIKNKILN